MATGLIAIEWVREYNGRLGNPVNTQTNAEGFYNTLNATQKFAHGDNKAQDKHFEQSGAGAPVAGSDKSKVEKVDMAYFAGHGSSLGFDFGVLQDDARAKPAEIRLGDGRLKWLAINACDVLFHNDTPSFPSIIDRWGQIFTGLRYILGFATLTSDEPDRGQIFAEYLNSGETIADAWMKACQDTEASFTTWAYLRADGNGVTTDQDTWVDLANIRTKPNPPSLIHYVTGAC
jgi:hypothetical protein